MCWWCGKRPHRPQKPGKACPEYCEVCKDVKKNFGSDKFDRYEKTISSRGAEYPGRKSNPPGTASHMQDEEEYE
jgi:hypothetical protein